MSSIRSRIEAFEALSKKSEDSSKDRKNESRKRFHYPGSKNRFASDQEDVALNNFIGMSKTANKTQDLSDLEADLQEVWSVRKNIHHNGATKQSGSATSNSMPSVQVKAGQYSRHGAIPAQQTQGPTQNKGLSYETKRAPLQEHNSKDTPWNVKKSSYSYNSQEVVNPTEPQAPAEKVSYAKRMAQGYLKSMGMGKYTPSASGYVKQSQSDESADRSKWKRNEDDFEFTEPKRNEVPKPIDENKAVQSSGERIETIRVDQPVSKSRSDQSVSASRSSQVIRQPEPKVETSVQWKRVDYTYDVNDRKKNNELVARPTEEKKDSDEKLNYARRMARGYLKSEGLGKYTPQTSGYVKQADESQSKWKRTEDGNGKNQDRSALTEEQAKKEKLNYAKRMARGYLQAEGLGEYSTTSSGYVKQRDQSNAQATTWRKVDDGSELEVNQSSQRRTSSEEHTVPPPQEKVSYAKRMAQGYLKSVGMGKYTPKSGEGQTKSSQSDESQKQSSTWKNLKVNDDQDFEFDI